MRHSTTQCLRIAAVVLAVSTTTKVSYADLVAHWPLTEGFGSTFNNLANPDFNGFLDGGTIIWEPIAEDEGGGAGEIRPLQEFAVRFTGPGSWIETEYPGIASNAPRTIAFWMKTDLPGANDMFGYGLPENGRKWHVRVNTNGNNGVLGAIRTEFQGGQNVGTTPIDDSLWHHVAIVFPEGGTIGEDIDHYVDGVLQDKSGNRAGIIDTTLDARYPVNIGRTRQTLASFRYFQGLIADVRVYDNELTVEEILAIPTEEPPPPLEVGPCTELSIECTVDARLNLLTAQVASTPEICTCGGLEFFAGEVNLGALGLSPEGTVQFRLDELCSTPGAEIELGVRCLELDVSATCTVICPERVGLVAHWPLDEGEGVVFDNLVSDDDGFLDPISSIEWVEGPPFQDFAVEFSGVDSWIQTDYPGIGGANPRTIACWIKTTNVANHGIISWGPDAPGEKWHIRLNSNAGNGPLGAPRIEINGGFSIATTPLNDDQWHHIAVIVPENSSLVSDILLYVDGELEVRGGLTDRTFSTRLDGEDVFRVGIGRRVNGNGTINYFPGSVADVRIYDEGLDQEGIDRIVSGGFCRVRRSLGADAYVPGDLLTVELNAINISGETTITETFPDGLTVFDTGGGVVEGSTITFTLSEEDSLTYILETTEDFCQDLVLAGTYTGDGEGCEGEVVGSALATCLCPPEGDTHCTGITIDPPSPHRAGSFTVTATASDDSGDAIQYLFTATSELGVLTQGPQAENSAVFELEDAEWTISVTVDDDPVCPDAADDATCEETLTVACPTEGDTHCSGLQIERDDVILDPAEVQDPGTFTIRATGIDDSGDAVMFTFTATSELGTLTEGPKPADFFLEETTATFELGRAEWAITVSVDDDDCEDAAPDMVCETTLIVGISSAQIPGDSNSDGALDISDGINLLTTLFLNADNPQPCAGAFRDSGNVTLQDFNGDAAIDLSDGVAVFNFLFLGGPPHVLGEGCQAIEECEAEPTCDA